MASSTTAITDAEDQLLRIITEAFATIELQYKFTVSPHPTEALAYRVVFSRPTFQLPESPTFVSMDVRAAPGDSAKRIELTATVEHTTWLLHFTIDSGRIHGFYEAYLDQIWAQKMKTRSLVE